MKISRMVGMLVIAGMLGLVAFQGQVAGPTEVQAGGYGQPQQQGGGYGQPPAGGGYGQPQPDKKDKKDEDKDKRRSPGGYGQPPAGGGYGR